VILFPTRLGHLRTHQFLFGCVYLINVNQIIIDFRLVINIYLLRNVSLVNAIAPSINSGDMYLRVPTFRIQKLESK